MVAVAAAKSQSVTQHMKPGVFVQKQHIATLKWLCLFSTILERPGQTLCTWKTHTEHKSMKTTGKKN